MMKRMFAVAAGLILFGYHVPTRGQAAAAPDKAQAFEVASVRRNTSQTNAGGMPHFGPTPDGYRATRVPLLLPILTAYIPSTGGDSAYYTNDLIRGGPDWLRSENYDIDAKVAEADLAEWGKPAAQKAMLRAMLQTLLAERCKLAVHREMKEFPIYALTVAKSGVKFKEAKASDPHPGAIVMPGGTEVVVADGGRTLHLYGATMVAVAQLLTNFAGRPVQDQTGLTGKYDIVFTREPPSPEGETSIFTSVQEQLGLRLDSSKGSVETLVIDHLERPSEN